MASRRLSWLLFLLSFSVAVAARPVWAQDSQVPPEWSGWTLEDPQSLGEWLFLGSDVALHAKPDPHYGGAIFRAGRLSREMEGETWSLEAHVHSQGGAMTHAGLVVYRDDENWLSWGLAGDGRLMFDFVRRGDVFTTGFDPGGVPDVLRVVRRGNLFQLQFRGNGRWSDAWSQEDPGGDLGEIPRAGLYGWADGTAADFWCSFHHVRWGPPPPERIEGVRALGASSSYPSWGPERTLEGIHGRAWCSAGGTPLPHWIDYEIPDSWALTEIEFDPHVSDTAEGYPGIQAKDLAIAAAPDDPGGVAERLGEISLALDDHTAVFRFEKPVRLSRLRIEILSNHGDATYTELGQVRLLGERVR